MNYTLSDCTVKPCLLCNFDMHELGKEWGDRLMQARNFGEVLQDISSELTTPEQLFCLGIVCEQARDQLRNQPFKKSFVNDEERQRHATIEAYTIIEKKPENSPMTFGLELPGAKNMMEAMFGDKMPVVAARITLALQDCDNKTWSDAMCTISEWAADPKQLAIMSFVFGTQAMPRGGNTTTIEIKL